jgi:hypothetical protein
VTAPLTQRSANAALSLGIAGLLFANFINLNLWLLTPALMFSGGAIVWGILGLVQVRKFGGPGSGKSRTGLILAGLAIVSMVTWGVLFSTGQNIVFDEAGVENGILNGNWTIAPDSVDCPATPSMKEGNTFECIATFSDGSTATVYIKVQDTSGNITWGTDPQ